MAIHQAKSNLSFVMSNFESSRAEGERVLALARQIGDRVSEGTALAEMGWASAWGHNFERALAYAQQAIEVATQADAKRVLARSHLTIGHVLAVTGRLDRAQEEFNQCRTISQSVDDVLAPVSLAPVRRIPHKLAGGVCRGGAPSVGEPADRPGVQPVSATLVRFFYLRGHSDRQGRL